ncbi:hypothetical protein SSS_08140 [Sarcoptes scabiei]|uniref:Uncharacterized protein n=1 Tax=Sarcoptes scabiei TaxID=52283 RepID=A0A132A9W6_SARSC|nr:hypothetical protein SSS_08140 [Sarcoptes scabiei]KPM07240.1 hypothetical protein QR98_0057290 [Sarcoptes scabiei]UXI14233.1 hypothetical protein NH340_JMT00176 [Sarcoptes scabiei]
MEFSIHRRKTSTIIWIISIAIFLCNDGFRSSIIEAQKITCNTATEKEMDNVMARIMTVGTDRKFPTDKDEMKAYCKEHVRLVAKLENYKNLCLKNQAKSVVAVIIFSIKQVTNTYCKHINSKKTAALIDSTVCANLATNDYHKCNKQYIQKLIASQNMKQGRDRFVQTCCGYFQIFDCVRAEAAKYPECTPERVELNVEYINTFFENAINTACGEYNNDSDKCDSSKIPAVKKTKKPLPKSFFKPLVNLISNI